ncbi:unnamed protein product [Rotaria sordida]|uniref:C2H2-type domain-containing protein n=1 Tax=Rotaria sordida TaxID=392033 RepID=A0A814PD78_9BILA|nr:unnamed protein product [Rotaria sordida]
MNFSSSPPVLYLGDDDDDNNHNKQNSYVETNMSLVKTSSSSSSSNDMNMSHKKRKLTNTNVRINPSIVNWSKRQRNDHYQQQTSRNFIDTDPDPEPILLDPDEYIIEEPDPPTFCSFDWTIQPPPPPLLPTKISSNHPIQTVSRGSTISNSNMNHIVQRSIDKLDNTNSNHQFIQQQQQQQRKPIAIPVQQQPSLALVSLPLPKPTTSFFRANVQRGRPVKNSRISYTQSTSPPLPVRRQPEQQIIPQTQKTSRTSLSSTGTATTTTTVTTTSLINNSTPIIRRQILNGTGLFSAFHDSKYYQCNICKFKSVTSSTLLQHLFTHMFFCDQCSFYTYSHYNLNQHMFEKHILNVHEHINDSSNPKSFDLLYVTRCSDGTFALCMDSSLTKTNNNNNTTTTTNNNNNNDQRLIISSAVLNDQHTNKISKKKISKQKDFFYEDDNDILILSDKSDINHRSLINSKGKEKQNQTYVIMKHRRCYLMKKTFRLHSLTLEYNICREHTLRQMCHTQDILKPRKFLTKFHQIQFNNEIANCLRTIVNYIINSEDNSDQSIPICTLPNHILSSILSVDNLDILTTSLKLNNKYDEYKQQNQLYEDEHVLRQSRKHIFILSSSDRNHNDQSIISSLHSSLTNGDSIFTQTKIDKLPNTYDNTYRYLKGNLNISSQLNNSNVKVQKKINTTQLSPPKLVPLRSVIPKSSYPPLPNHPSLSTIIDRNNNSVTSLKSKISTTKMPNIIVLD